MGEILRVGCVGNGNLGNVHIKAYLGDPKKRVKIVALCDIVPEKMDNAIEKHGLGEVGKYTDYREMIEKENLDIVDIATPNHVHACIAIFALNHGCHVFCEKPDAIKVEEVLQMKKASEDAHKTLMVMRNNRYTPNAAYLKKYITEGKAGEIYCGKCCYIRRRGIPGKGGWFNDKTRSGGGPLIDLGVHIIDLSMWLMGNPKPVSVSANTFSKFSEYGFIKNDDGTTRPMDVEDLAMGVVRFENGAILQFETSWASNIKESRKYLELRGTKAGVYWDSDGTTEIYTEDSDGTLVDLYPKVGSKAECHAKNIHHFLDVITEGADPAFVPEEGVNMIKLLCAVYESARTGKEVIL